MDRYPNIDKVGVELEGGWERDSEWVDDLKGDCSVEVNDDGSERDYDEDEDEYHDRYQNGEMVSPPIAKWDELSNFILNRYPDKVNHTCGLHVHVSTKTVAQYEALATERFYNFMKYSLRNWGNKNKPKLRNSDATRFWSRLRGENHYCEDIFTPDTQMFDHMKSGNRYAIVNYCYSLHGTMEVRVLPMFNRPSISVSAVNQVIWTVNKYLSLPSVYKSEEFDREELIEMDVDLSMISAVAVNE